MKKPDHYILLHLFLCTSQEKVVKAINAPCDSFLLILVQGNKSNFLNPVCLGPGRHSDGLLCCLNARWHTLTFALFLKNMQCYFHKGNHTTGCWSQQSVGLTRHHILVSFTLGLEERL